MTRYYNRPRDREQRVADDEMAMLDYVARCTPEENTAFLRALTMESTKTWPPEKKRRARSNAIPVRS